MDSPPSPPPPLHLRRHVHDDRHPGHPSHLPHATDIFPEIDIPVVSVIWSYAGISPEEMAEVVTIRCERSFTTSVHDIEHMESQSLPGLSIIKVFFHAGAKVDSAVAQLAAASQAVLHSLPTGMTPPSILRYNASSVPILQLSISSDTMSESSLYDYGYNFIRTSNGYRARRHHGRY
ncbi:MAG TPA: efflux RND transporter permease subunit [Bryobacteraceae bacterium]|nr:efflux RND transporter permease subunit [Bryobacteraceae bacterium]